MSGTKNDDFSHNENSRDCSDFSAPLGTLKSGRLVFTSGAERLKFKADPSMPSICQARFKRYALRIWVQKNVITIESRRYPFLGQPVNLRTPLAEIRLNGSIPLEIEFRNGVSHLNADLEIGRAHV